MLDIGDPFTKAELSEAFTTADKAITDFAAGLVPERFFAHPPGVWSVGENVQHLILTVGPVAKAVLIPREKLSKRFGLSERPSRRYSAIRAEYEGVLEGGLDAPPQFVPLLDGLPPDPKTGQEQLISGWRALSQQMRTDLDGWTETELDTYQLPHLFFGMMTMREMLFFTLYHNLHHLDYAQRLVETHG
jgi:hypothetical protein